MFRLKWDDTYSGPDEREFDTWDKAHQVYQQTLPKWKDGWYHYLLVEDEDGNILLDADHPKLTLL